MKDLFLDEVDELNHEYRCDVAFNNLFRMNNLEWIIFVVYISKFEQHMLRHVHTAVADSTSFDPYRLDSGCVWIGPTWFDKAERAYMLVPHCRSTPFGIGWTRLKSPLPKKYEDQRIYLMYIKIYFLFLRVKILINFKYNA